MSLLQHAALAVVIFALLWWLTGFAVAGAYRLLRRPLDTLQPETRTRALTGIAVLPALLAGALWNAGNVLSMFAIPRLGYSIACKFYCC